MSAVSQQILLGRSGVAAGDPYFANVSFLSDFEGANNATTLTEQSSNAQTVTFVNQAKIDTSQSKFGTSSLRVDGTGDVVTCPSSSIYQLSNGPWTWETWYRPFAQPASSEAATMLALYDTNSQRSWGMRYTNNGGPTALDVLTSTNGTAGTISPAVSDTLANGSWYFISGCCDGSFIRIHRDGVFKVKAAFSSTLFNSTAKFSIGGLLASGVPPAGTSGFANGWFGPTRVTKGVDRYASDSNYAVPTAAFPTF